jgi:hypothetical protein
LGKFQPDAALTAFEHAPAWRVNQWPNSRAPVALLRAQTWVQIVMRHSYASYWLAEHADIDRLTIFLGHTNPTMLWKHYHRTATHKEASKYWQIMPSTSAGRKVVSIAAA